MLQCITVAPLKVATPLKRPPIKIGLCVTVCSPTSIYLTSLCKSATPLIRSLYLSHLDGRIEGVLHSIVLVFVFLFCPPRYQCSCSGIRVSILSTTLPVQLFWYSCFYFVHHVTSAVVLVFVFLFCPPRYQCSCSGIRVSMLSTTLPVQLFWYSCFYFVHHVTSAIVLVFVFLFCPPRYQCSCSGIRASILSTTLPVQLLERFTYLSQRVSRTAPSLRRIDSSETVVD